MDDYLKQYTCLTSNPHSLLNKLNYEDFKKYFDANSGIIRIPHSQEFKQEESSALNFLKNV